MTPKVGARSPRVTAGRCGCDRRHCFEQNIPECGEKYSSFGAIMSVTCISVRRIAAIFWIALFGSYVNWVFTLLGGVFGSSRLTPVAGSGFSAAVWQENFIAAGLIPMTFSMVVCCLLVLRGLRGFLPVEK